MKCKLPNQDAGTTRLYLGDVMGASYDPPGIDVNETDDGVRFIRVRATVGDALIENHGFAELVEESADEDATTKSDNEV